MTTTTFIFLLPPQWNGEAGLRLVGIPPFGLLASRPTSPPQLPSPRLGLRERMSHVCPPLSPLPSSVAWAWIPARPFVASSIDRERMHQYAFSTLKHGFQKFEIEVGKGTLASRVCERCGKRRGGKNGDDGAEDLEALKGKERPLFATPRPTPPTSSVRPKPPRTSNRGSAPRDSACKRDIQKKGGRHLFFFSLLLRCACS